MAGRPLTGDLGPELIGPAFVGIRTSAITLVELATLNARSILLLNPAPNIVMGEDISTITMKSLSVGIMRIAEVKRLWDHRS